jgi:signal transduction histidine kinase
VTDDRQKQENSHLADVLEHSRGEILTTYEERLTSVDSRLVATPMAREQCIKHGDLMIHDLLQELRTDSVGPAEQSVSLPWEIGITRAATEVHPRESLDATVILFDLVTRRAAEHLNGRPDAGSLMYEVSAALNRSIIRRISEASSAYTGFLLSRIHQAQLEERQRIAREMHDRLGHELGVALRSVEYSRHLARDVPEAEERLLAARDAVRESMHTIRAISSGLRVTKPVRSLEVMLGDFLSNANPGPVHTQLVVNGDDSWCHPTVLDEAFLVIREAAHNAFTHSRAQRVMVRVNISPDHLHAMIDDDGDGFEVHQMLGKGTGGLPGMHHRTRALGGTVTVTSRLGRGIKVEFSVPLIPQETAPAGDGGHG